MDGQLWSFCTALKKIQLLLVESMHVNEKVMNALQKYRSFIGILDHNFVTFSVLFNVDITVI